MLLNLSKMYLSRLLGNMLVVQLLIAKLLARQIEGATINHIEAVVVAVSQRNTVHLSAKEVLHKKRRNGALAERPILLAPTLAHARGTRLGSPELAELVVRVTWSEAIFVKNLGLLPSEEAIHGYPLLSA